MNLTFRQLQTFVEVMRHTSVTEAARALGRTQPAVSAMIAGLEREIGYALFERVRKRLVPKPEAYYFMEEAEYVLGRLTRSTRTLQEIGNLEKGSLKIACNPAASHFFMPSIVGKFLEDKPNVKMTMLMRSSPIVTDWIASQQYDIGFAEASEDRRTIRAIRSSFPCLCAIPRNDPLANKSVITPEDLDGKPLAMLFEDHDISVKLRDIFRDAKVNLNQRFELQTCLSAIKLVSLGLCYSICESLTARSYERTIGSDGPVVFRPFEPTVHLEMGLMTPANRPLSLLVEELVSHMQTEIEALISQL